MLIRQPLLTNWYLSGKFYNRWIVPGIQDSSSQHVKCRGFSRDAKTFPDVFFFFFFFLGRNEFIYEIEIFQNFQSFSMKREITKRKLRNTFTFLNFSRNFHEKYQIKSLYAPLSVKSVLGTNENFIATIFQNVWIFFSSASAKFEFP